MTKRKVASRPDYTRRKSGCVVYTVEVIMRHSGEVDDAECLSRGIEEFRNYGSAEIVQVDAVAETWDDACDILKKRMVS